jgi:hypothetical protein
MRKISIRMYKNLYADNRKHMGLSLLNKKSSIYRAKPMNN